MAPDANVLTTVKNHRDLSVANLPPLIADASPTARLAWDEFFGAMIRNRHTRAAYVHAVRRFFVWVEIKAVSLKDILPGLVGQYLDTHPGNAPTRNLHLSALRAFFDVLVNRHAIVFNPAATVHGERYEAIEGKTPEMTVEQARTLLESIKAPRPVARRDKAIIATLIYTAARAGAVAGLRLKDFSCDGTQYALRFREKGGKSRLIPVRHDLQLILLAYLDCFDWKSEPGDAPLFRSVAGRAGKLTSQPVRNIDICRLVKRRLRDAGLPDKLSPHSFRVVTVTDLLTQGVPLEDVQYLAGHADPRTTRLYDRRQRRVTRNTVERISILNRLVPRLADSVKSTPDPKQRHRPKSIFYHRWSRGL
jgi:integrase/recombinase XerD